MPPINWQTANIQAAATYMRERIAAGATDARTFAVYEGLVEILDPNRRKIRLQRALAESAKAATTVQANRERRAREERRDQRDRRTMHLGPPDGVERRAGERRAARDRRTGG